MGLDVWFQEDVARALRAAYVAGREAHLGSGRSALLSCEMAAYWRGYQAALATIGTAFGLTSPIVEVSSQKVGANPCGCPSGQIHPQIPSGEDLPLPQDIEKILVDPILEADSSPHLTGTPSQLKANGLARAWDLDAAGEGE